MNRFWYVAGQVVVEAKFPDEGVWLSTRQVPSFVVDSLVCGATDKAGIERAARSVIMTGTSGNINSVSMHVEPLTLDESILLDMLREVRASKRPSIDTQLFGESVAFEVMLMTTLFEQHGIEVTLMPHSERGRYAVAFALTTDTDEVDDIARDIEQCNQRRAVLMYGDWAPNRAEHATPVDAWTISNGEGRSFVYVPIRPDLPTSTGSLAKWAASVMKSGAWTDPEVYFDASDVPAIGN